MKIKLIILVIITLLTMNNIYSAGTYEWYLDNYHTFNKGKLIKTKINEDGVLSISPEFSRPVELDAMFIWDIKEDSKGNIYLATGNDGIIYKIDTSGNIKPFFTTSSIAAFRMLIDKKDNLYVATLSKGLIYKITPKGKGSVFKVFHDDYIWDMKFYKGDILLATGTPGSIYKLDLKTKKLNDIILTKEMHVTCMDIDGKNNIYFGTSDKGAIYKLTSDKKLKVIYQTDQKEVHSIVINKKKGIIYAGTSDKEFNMVKVKDQDRFKPSIKNNSTRSKKLFDDLKDLKKLKLPANTVYEIKENEYVNKIIESKETTFLKLLMDKDTLYIGSGDKGNIYRYKDNKVEKITQLDEQQVLSFLKLKNNNLVFGTGNIGNFYKLNINYAKEGTYISDIFDAQGWAFWGKIQWDERSPDDTSIDFQTRSGNVEDIDDTWSDWSKNYIKKDGSQISSPSGRFFQFKINLKTDNKKKTPDIYSVKIPYLIKNRKPEIISVKFIEKENNKSKNSDKKKSFKKFDLKEFDLKLEWKTKDTDKDTLEYSLLAKLRKEKEWLLLKDKIDKVYYKFDRRTLPDGIYLFKLIADDIPSNSISTHLTEKYITKPFIIDHTPPDIKINYKKIKNNTYTIKGNIIDKLSGIASISYSVDTKSWTSIFPEDKIFDSKNESFEFQYKYKNGIIILKAEDEAGNSTTSYIKIKK